VLAWLAGQDDLVQAFRDKQDVYKLMATKIYGIAVGDVDKTQRQVGKTVVLGAGYGVGHVKLQGFLKNQAGVEVTLEEAKRIIDTYRSTSYKIAEFWKAAGEALNDLMQGYTSTIDAIGLIKVVPGAGLTLPSGLHIQYPKLRKITNEEGKTELVYTSKGLPVRIYGGKVVENICQAVARQVVAEQMLRVSKRYKVVLTVHDAVAIVAKKEEAAEAQAYLEECMSWNPKWAVGLPLSCESGMGASYGDC
jgi:DNA polymerase bacteriophage-type